MTSTRLRRYALSSSFSSFSRRSSVVIRLPFLRLQTCLPVSPAIVQSDPPPVNQKRRQAQWGEADSTIGQLDRAGLGHTMYH